MDRTLVTPGDQSFSFNKSQVLGQGRNGDVYVGQYNGENVAVKCVLLSPGQAKSTSREEVLVKLDHANVIKLIHFRNNEDFRCYALELCAADLDQYCKGDYTGPIPSDADVLYQLTIGLDYVHSECIHRDIKPKNILISRQDSIVKMKWADFGLSKAINENGSCSTSGFHGTENWRAPEFLRLREGLKGRGSRQSDIFSAGLVFFYFLKRGLHPFGKGRMTIDTNIENNEPANMQELAENHFAKAFITKMIAHKAKDRISLKEIIQLLESYRIYQPSISRCWKQWPVNKAHSVETDFSRSPVPKTTVKPPKKRTNTRKQQKENIMSIAAVRSENRKKPRWAVKARVIGKTRSFKMESHKPGIPARTCFYMTLEDESGQIRARACTANICKKFYGKFQEGKEYLIKKIKMMTLDDRDEPILCLQTITEVSVC